MQKHILAAAMGLVLAACSGAQDAEVQTASLDEGKVQPVTAATIIADDDRDWITHGGDYAETRFSTLDQITPTSLRDAETELGLAWTFDLGTDRGVEATPLVHDGIMYVTTTFNIVHAIDIDTGQALWTFTPEIDKSQAANACCGVVNRGVALYDDTVFVATIDGRLIALDQYTGRVKWDVLTVDQSKPYTITGAPRVIETQAGQPLVIIGNGGAELGVRGYVGAYDVGTGKQAWRFYTVPGNPADGFENATMEMAAETWAGEWWEAGGGGTAWDAFAHDPELDLLYIGVGNGSPWNHEERSDGEGDNLFLSSIVAVRPATGEYVWHYQTTPGDTWDYTATQHMILADLEIEGETRQVIMQAPKNGFFYVIDRATGEFISGDAFAAVTWAEGIDENGRPIEVPGARYASAENAGGAPFIHLPGPLGAHNWHPMSYSPADKGGTGLVYIPAQQAAWVFFDQEDYDYSDVEGVWNTATNMAGALLPDDPAIIKALRAGLKGQLVAWDPVAKAPRWTVDHSGPWNGGVLSTAGGVVFQGTADARFAAFDAGTGERIWDDFVGTGIVAAPVTFEHKGEQYVAVAAGWGGSYAIGYGGVFPTEATENVGRLLVYKAGGTAENPARLEMASVDGARVIPAALDVSPEVLAVGKQAYANCSVCHGDGVISHAGMKNLRYSPITTDAEAWHEVLLEGSLAEMGMPNFEGFLDADTSEAIRAYVIHEANSSRTEDFYRETQAEVLGARKSAPAGTLGGQD